MGCVTLTSPIGAGGPLKKSFEWAHSSFLSRARTQSAQSERTNNARNAELVTKPFKTICVSRDIFIFRFRLGIIDFSSILTCVCDRCMPWYLGPLPRYGNARAMVIAKELLQVVTVDGDRGLGVSDTALRLYHVLLVGGLHDLKTRESIIGLIWEKQVFFGLLHCIVFEWCTLWRPYFVKEITPFDSSFNMT